MLAAVSETKKDKKIIVRKNDAFWYNRSIELDSLPTHFFSKMNFKQSAMNKCVFFTLKFLIFFIDKKKLKSQLVSKTFEHIEGVNFLIFKIGL